jgi:hypothetical protein
MVLCNLTPKGQVPVGALSGRNANWRYALIGSISSTAPTREPLRAADVALLPIASVGAWTPFNS